MTPSRISWAHLDRALKVAQTFALAAIAAALCWIALEISGLRRSVDYMPTSDTQPIADELDRANDRLERQDRSRLSRELEDPLGLFR